MTKRLTISVPDEIETRLRALIEAGDYASASEVFRAGLRLIEQERADERRREEEQQARLEAIRQDLKRRMAEPGIPFEQVTQMLAARRAEKQDQRTKAS